jgi:hypothetical protein
LATGFAECLAGRVTRWVCENNRPKCKPTHVLSKHFFRGRNELLR